MVELAKIFEVPVEELMNNMPEYHFSFQNNRVANGMVEHYYEAAKETHEQHIAHLMEIIRLLVEKRTDKDILALLEELLQRTK